jgi:mono/diheme cytochrome c family protein
MKKDSHAIDMLEKMESDPSADVRFQLLLTMRFVKSDKSKQIIADLIKNYPNDPMLAFSQNKYDADMKQRAEQARRQSLLSTMGNKLVTQGSVIFKQLCFTCHGVDGKGVIIGGTTSTAPALAGNLDVNGRSPDKLIRLLLHGLSGPIRGTVYPDAMPAMGGNDDVYIASVLSYIRSDFGNKGSIVLPEDVKAIRDANAGRTKAWTMDELDAIRPARRGGN